ncbi:GNAT family N-acetyltransferase [Myxosarcina sp. GI1(2024)]
MYVLSTKRRQGIGSQLIEKIIRQAKPHFEVLNLRTNNGKANKFYLA